MFRANCIVTAALLAALFAQSAARGQGPPGDASAPGPAPSLESLPLEREHLLEVRRALAERDYRRAETILVGEAERDPGSRRAAALLAAAGGLFFLDGQFLNAAIAYKKADAVVPLDERGRFTLAMACVKLGRADWARAELEALAARHPATPLYLYWLARLDYDANDYRRAIARFEKVLELDPEMMRAHDGLGLCYDYLGEFDLAIASYDRAVAINRRQARPSPWPHVNLAVSLAAVNRLEEAEAHLREALRYDSELPQAHYQLALVLEKRGRHVEALGSALRAAELDPAYPEPLYTAGRLYHRQGDAARAKQCFERFQELKAARPAGPRAGASGPM
jgi:tetratricopeptide (TPR) repeat protein